MAFLLRVRYPNGQELSFPLDQPVTFLGSSTGNDIRLGHDFISDRHLRFDVKGTRISIQDLGSVDGTLVNQQALDLQMPRLLRSGDEIIVGPLSLLVDSHDPEAFAGAMTASLELQTKSDPTVVGGGSGDHGASAGDLSPGGQGEGIDATLPLPFLDSLDSTGGDDRPAPMWKLNPDTALSGSLEAPAGPSPPEGSGDLSWWEDEPSGSADGGQSMSDVAWQRLVWGSLFLAVLVLLVILIAILFI